MTIKEEFCASAHFGSEGPAGTPGKDGMTPFINAAGNWQIGDNDTGVKAAGKDGTPGAAGLTPFVNGAGNWQIGGNDTGVKAAAKDGKDGAPGKDGLSASVNVAGTETLEPEENAEVLNRGTGLDARLFFRIPRGERGEETTLRQPHYDTFADLAKAHPQGTVQEAYVAGPLNDIYIWDPVIHNWVSVGRLGWLPEEFQNFKETVQEHMDDTDNPHRVTKAQVGLDKADNTADADKPVSNAVQAALDKKQDKLSAAQLAAANSGVTAAKVQKYDGYETTLANMYSKEEVNEIAANAGTKYTAGANITISGDTISAQVPEGVFTRKNLIGGAGVEIIPEPVESAFDEHTLACFHFENNFDNEIADSPVGVENAAGSFTQDYKKFGQYSLAGGPRITLTRSANINDFTADAWVLLNNNYAWHSIQIGVVSITPSNGGWNVSGAGINERYVPEQYLNAWLHIAVVRKDMVYYVFFNGKLTAVSEVSSTTNNTLFSWQADSFYYALDELRVSDVARWTEDFTPPADAYPYEPTGRYVVNVKTGEGLEVDENGNLKTVAGGAGGSGEDINKYLTNCVLEAPNGGVVSVLGKRWYDYWGTLGTSQKADRSMVWFTSSLRCKNNMSYEQINGNWTMITKVKFVYKTTSTGVKGRIASVAGKRISSPDTNTSFADIRLSNVSTGIGKFRSIIFPTDWQDTESYVIDSAVSPVLDTWYWVKLQKNGHTFTLSYSTDGINYTVLGSLANVPAFEQIADNSGYFSICSTSNTASNKSYHDLTSNEFNNLFFGTGLTPLITYEETPDSIKANQGLKVLIPNEKNEDGTLKSITYVLENALTANVPTVNGRYLMALYQDGTLAFYKKEMLFVSHVFGSITTDKIWYSPKFNYFKMYEDGSWQIKYFAIIGEVRVENGIIKESNYNIPVNLNAPNLDFAPSNIDYVVESYSDADGNWYRRYKSGWLEQGGITNIVPATQSVTTITLFKPFASTVYGIVAANNPASINWATHADLQITAKTTTSFGVSSNVSNNNRINWYACGQGE
ncbi:MAG: hypothetical protein ACI37O_04260 [Candidatus Avelusimicrobium sp.]|uniref:hypothetical protein n=1 Tax=Candidatus Avelusimicrobium sp. TaxID=3048833 RepID=UPI003F121AE9